MITDAQLNIINETLKDGLKKAGITVANVVCIIADGITNSGDRHICRLHAVRNVSKETAAKMCADYRNDILGLS